MIRHSELNQETLHKLIRQTEITFAGNSLLKIYGTLSCVSGKRMKKENRIFFTNSNQAVNAGFRPCGHCMHNEFTNWKLSKKQVEQEDNK